MTSTWRNNPLFEATIAPGDEILFQPSMIGVARFTPPMARREKIEKTSRRSAEGTTRSRSNGGSGRSRSLSEVSSHSVRGIVMTRNSLEDNAQRLRRAASRPQLINSSDPFVQVVMATSQAAGQPVPSQARPLVTQPPSAPRHAPSPNTIPTTPKPKATSASIAPPAESGIGPTGDSEESDQDLTPRAARHPFRFPATAASKLGLHSAAQRQSPPEDEDETIDDEPTPRPIRKNSQPSVAKIIVATEIILERGCAKEAVRQHQPSPPQTPKVDAISVTDALHADSTSDANEDDLTSDVESVTATHSRSVSNVESHELATLSALVKSPPAQAQSKADFSPAVIRSRTWHDTLPTQNSSNNSDRFLSDVWEKQARFYTKTDTFQNDSAARQRVKMDRRISAPVAGSFPDRYEGRSGAEVGTLEDPLATGSTSKGIRLGDRARRVKSATSAMTSRSDNHDDSIFGLLSSWFGGHRQDSAPSLPAAVASSLAKMSSRDQLSTGSESPRASFRGHHHRASYDGRVTYPAFGPRHHQRRHSLHHRDSLESLADEDRPYYTNDDDFDGSFSIRRSRHSGWQYGVGAESITSSDVDVGSELMDPEDEDDRESDYDDDEAGDLRLSRALEEQFRLPATAGGYFDPLFQDGNTSTQSGSRSGNTCTQSGSRSACSAQPPSLSRPAAASVRRSFSSYQPKPVTPLTLPANVIEQIYQHTRSSSQHSRVHSPSHSQFDSDSEHDLQSSEYGLVASSRTSPEPQHADHKTDPAGPSRRCSGDHLLDGGVVPVSPHLLQDQMPPAYYRLGVCTSVDESATTQASTKRIVGPQTTHTVYKITVKLLRSHIPGFENDAPVTLTLWKRYREFRALYLNLMKSYKGVVGGWPEFPKKSFFDRFNPAIIQQRLTSFATLLNFIVLHPKLYNGPQLLSFLGVADGSGRPRHEGNRTRTTTANGGGGGFVIWERATTPAVSTTDDPARKNRGKGLWGIVPRGGLLGIGKERAT